jgi:membrane-associated phospholipid phosphatase
MSAEIRELAGPVVTDAFAALTHLGDPMFLLALIAVYYWLSERREAPVRLIAFTLLAVALTVSLKNGLALPRPPTEVRAVAEYSESYGFPSGHALGATVVYGGFVVVDERLRRPGTALAALSLVACIGLSRVVIGVH